jgi:hypothetical protein
MKRGKTTSPNGVTAAALQASQAKKRQAEAFKHHRTKKSQHRLSFSHDRVITEEDAD